MSLLIPGNLPAPAEGEFTVLVRAQRVNATQAAQLIRSFDRSFAAHARMRGRTSRLQVVRAGSGSFWATFGILVSTYEIMSDHKEIIAMFLHDFSAVVSAVEQGATKNAPKHLIDLVRSVGRLGQKVAADTIEVAGLLSIVIHADSFGNLAAASADDEAQKPIGTKPQNGGKTVLVDRRALLEAGAHAERGQLFGTVFNVEGDWYARAEGMSGVLLPLRLGVQSKLAAVHKRVFRIVGTVENGPEGYPVAIAAKELIPQPEQ